MEIFTQIMKTSYELFSKAFSFGLWVILAVIILPCVFVSTVVYPAWEKWGEKF